MPAYNGEFLTRAELEQLGIKCGGDDVLVHASVVIIHPENLSIGNHVRIDPFCIMTAGGFVKIGNYVHISSHCTLVGGAGIEIGDYAGVANGVRIYSVSDDFSGRYLMGPTLPGAYREVTSAPVQIMRFAGIGASAVIMPGVVIEEGAVVGVHSFVRTKVDAWTIWAGVPARYIRDRLRDVLKFDLSRLSDGENVTP